MALASPRTVHIERPETALVDTMLEMRSWLDHAALHPVDFKMASVGYGSIGFDVTFGTAADAGLFREAFI
jgi:hypothetical protein